MKKKKPQRKKLHKLFKRKFNFFYLLASIVLIAIVIGVASYHLYQRGVLGVSTSDIKTSGVAPRPPTTGNIKVAVVLFTLQANLNSISAKVPTSDVHKMFFDSPYSVRAFFNETSYGKAKLQGDVYGWYGVDQSQINSCADMLLHPFQGANYPFLSYMNTFVGQKIGDPNWVSKYDYIVYESGDCMGNNGVATAIPGKYVVVGGPLGDFDFFWPSSSWVAEVSHELGHAFGLQHADSFFCNDHVSMSKDPNNQCIASEYGDPFDVMGNINGLSLNSTGETGGNYTVQENAYHKLGLNWISSNNIQDIQKSGTYKLFPIEQNKVNPITLQIISGKDPTSGRTRSYYVEFRQPIGTFDPAWAGRYPSYIFQGITMRVAPIDQQPPFYVNYPAILYESYSTADLARKLVYLPGDKFTDPNTNLTIKLLGLDRNTSPVSANVQITINPNDRNISGNYCSNKYTGGLCQKSCGSAYTQVSGLCSQPGPFVCCIKAPATPTPTPLPKPNPALCNNGQLCMATGFCRFQHGVLGKSCNAGYYCCTIKNNNQE